MSGMLRIAQVGAVLLRHLPPLAGLLALGWSAGQFLVCAVFNTVWPIGVIAATNVVVSDRQVAGATRGEAQQISDLLRLSAIALLVSLVLGALFGWIVVVMAMQGDARTFDRSLGASLAMTVFDGLPAAFSQYRYDLAAGFDEAMRKRRDQPTLFASLASAAILFFVSGQLAQWDRDAMRVLVFLLTALFIVRDLWPGWLRRALPLGGAD